MSPAVLSVAYPFAPVGRDAVGGAEQILRLLDESLVDRGCRSVVIACEGSEVRGELLPIAACPGNISASAREQIHAQVRLRISEALQTFPIDVVHFHGVDFGSYLPSDGIPLLATLHLPPPWYSPEIFSSLRPGMFLQCVSESEHRDCPASSLLVPPIENGVPLDEYRPVKRKGLFALALGRICPEKGFHLALDASRRADATLLLGGKVFGYEEHERYFCKEIVPRLDARRKFLGPLPLQHKRRLLAEARCLLVPSVVTETSSLVAMEALASGTPVIAFRRGALAEIVEHGRTGFLVSDENEMAEAIRQVGSLDPSDCVEAAGRRFSAARMADEYIELYRKIAEDRAAISNGFREHDASH